MNLKSYEIEKNFKIAFAEDIKNESNYTYFASIAKPKEMNQFIKKEKNFENRYNAILDNLKNKKTFDRTTDVVWFCKKCGFVHIGAEAPLSCPICKCPQPYFEIQSTDSQNN